MPIKKVLSKKAEAEIQEQMDKVLENVVPGISIKAIAHRTNMNEFKLRAWLRHGENNFRPIYKKFLLDWNARLTAPLIDIRKGQIDFILKKIEEEKLNIQFFPIINEILAQAERQENEQLVFNAPKQIDIKKQETRITGSINELKKLPPAELARLRNEKVKKLGLKIVKDEASTVEENKDGVYEESG